MIGVTLSSAFVAWMVTECLEIKASTAAGAGAAAGLDIDCAPTRTVVFSTASPSFLRFFFLSAFGSEVVSSSTCFRFFFFTTKGSGSDCVPFFVRSCNPSQHFELQEPDVEQDRALT